MHYTTIHTNRDTTESRFDALIQAGRQAVAMLAKAEAETKAQARIDKQVAIDDARRIRTMNQDAEVLLDLLDHTFITDPQSAKWDPRYGVEIVKRAQTKAWILAAKKADGDSSGYDGACQTLKWAWSSPTAMKEAIELLAA
jgi:hypothetical protein